MPSENSAAKAPQQTESELRICYDRVVGDERQPAPDVTRNNRAAIVEMKKWPTDHRTITCCFLDGDDTQRERVEAKAHLWEKHANVQFKFVTSNDADIRISFSADSGSWSAVGIDALVERYFPKYQPTMNFGWLKADTDDEEYERVVVHEFGHALGLIHEHQSPDGNLDWKRAEVYRAFSGPPNYWTKEEIDHNILARYSPEGIDNTRFDPDSIMLYMFPGSLFTDGKPTKKNTKLSKLDKEFISEEYPF